MIEGVDKGPESARRWRRFIFAMIGSGVAWYCLIVLVLLITVMAAHRERIYDVRDFPSNYFNQADLAGSYLSRTVTPDSIIFVGSSFSFAYSWAAQFSFPAVLARDTGKPVVNASVLGAGFREMKSYLLCELARRALRPRVIVVEIPLVNELDKLARPGVKNRMEPCDGRFAPSLPLVIAMHPTLKWWRHTRDIYRAFNYDYPDVVLNPLPRDYFVAPADFERVKADFALRVKTIVSDAGMQADQVFAFVTPVYTPGVPATGHDRANVETQFAFAETVCVELLGGRCIKTGHLNTRNELFANVTHLSIRGNAIFNAELQRAMASGGSP